MTILQYARNRMGFHCSSIRVPSVHRIYRGPQQQQIAPNFLWPCRFGSIVLGLLITHWITSEKKVRLPNRKVQIYIPSSVDRSHQPVSNATSRLICPHLISNVFSPSTVRRTFHIYARKHCLDTFNPSIRRLGRSRPVLSVNISRRCWCHTLLP